MKITSLMTFEGLVQVEGESFQRANLSMVSSNRLGVKTLTQWPAVKSAELEARLRRLKILTEIEITLAQEISSSELLDFRVL